MSIPLTAESAMLLFLTPVRNAKQDTAEVIQQWDSIVSSSGEKIAVWHEGKGPNVLVVHGWSGQHTDMASFVIPLVTAGYRVVSLDLPAHGVSDGEITSIPEMAEAILSVVATIGSLHGIIAHSAGCAATAIALKRGLVVRPVLIAAPARFSMFVDSFSKHSGVDYDALLVALARRGIDVESIDIPLIGSTLNGGALIIHSKDDRIIPIAEGQKIADAWIDSHFIAYEDLGHKKILSNPNVIAEVVSFINN
jgi:pimeloyl-ACP methyl ester carboxylesterase